MFNWSKLGTIFSHKLDYIRSGWRGKLLTTFFLLFSLFTIGMVIYSEQTTFATYHWQIRPIWLLFTLISFALTFFLSAYVWHRLVNRFASPLSFRLNSKYWAYANFAKRIPTPIWYIASRATLYEQQSISKMTISLLSALELVLILISGLLVIGLLLPFWVIPQSVATSLTQSWLLLAFIPVAIFLLYPKNLNYLWRKCSPQPPQIPLNWFDTISNIFIFIGIWGLGAIGLFCVVNIIYPLPMQAIIPIIGVWTIANTISLAGTLTLGNIGLREISLVLFLTSLTNPPTALISAILVRILWLFTESLRGVISLLL